MSYLVLARKWRPQRFDDVIGQGHVVHTLQNAVKKDRLAHAFLFTGARGVGKTTAARLLAKALNCQDGPTAEPCGECQNCKEIASSHAVDVLEIDGASNRGIDQVRELRDGVRYMPQHARFKIIIIDEVHMLTTEAFNALLKTLEEPPAHVKFIFATTEPHKIPITILSRCQRFDFKRIAPGEIVAHLRRIIDAEGLHAEDEALHQVARAGQGSMRDALSLLDQAIAYAEGAITTEVASEALGIIDRRVVVQMVEAVLARDAKAALDAVATAYKAGYDMHQLLSELVEELRHLVVARCVDDAAPLVDLPDRELELLAQRAQQASLEDLQRLFSMALDHVDLVARADSPRLVVDVLLARMASMPPYQSLETLSTLIAQLQGGQPVTLPPRGSGGGPTGGGARGSASAGQARTARGSSPSTATSKTAAPKTAPSRSASSRPDASKSGSAARERSQSPSPVPSGSETSDASPPPAASPPAAALPGVDRRWQQVVDGLRAQRPAAASFLEHGVARLVDEGQLELRFEQAFYAEAVRETEHHKALTLLVAQVYGPEVSLKIEVGAAPGSVESSSAEGISIAEAASLRDQQQEATREAEALADPTVKMALEIFGGKVLEIKPS